MGGLSSTRFFQKMRRDRYPRHHHRRKIRGARGGDVSMQTLAIEEMSRIYSYRRDPGAHSNLCAHNIHRNASEGLKEKYLPPMIRGEKIGAMALTEPNAGSDAMSIRTRAVRKGDTFLLTGSKIFITNGPVKNTLLVYAKTAPEQGAKGISAFIVEKDFPGFFVSRKLKKCGIRGSPTAELVFEDCEVQPTWLARKITASMS